MKPKKLLALVLSLAMIISALPTFSLSAAAETTETTTTTEKNITLDTSALKGAQQSNVYFGTYQQSSLGNTPPTEGTENVDWIKSDTATKNGQGAYYKKEPIRWRVLSNADGKAFLLSDKNLDAFRYYADSKGDAKRTTWAASTIHSWLNGTTTEDFYGSAFGATEKGAIAETTVATTGSRNTTDKVFLLSIEEVQNTAYGFTDNTGETDTRIAANTAYVLGGGKNSTTGMAGFGGVSWWWLRSPGSSSYYYAVPVTHSGVVYTKGAYVNTHDIAVRPAFNLNLSSVLFTSAAKGGKTVSTGAVSKNADLSTLTDNDGYKLTLKDSGRNFTISDTAAKTVKTGDTLSLEYTGATTGTNEYISAMIVNANGEVIYYGQLAQPAEASGTVSLTIPSDIEAGAYTLKVFNEQINGDYKTDYSSAFVNIPLTVTNLTFNTNGGTINSGNPAYYTEGETTTLPTDVTKDGYVFGGWYTNADLTGDKVTEIAATETGNKEYFAKWTYMGNVSTGTDILKGGQQSYIYFGTYQQSSAGENPPEGTEGVDWIKSTTATQNDQGPYYKKEPIRWRVLSNADGKALLLSDKNLDIVRYHEEREEVTWGTSTIRSWLNGYGAELNQNSVDYSSDNFIGAAFGAAEKGVIADTTVVNADNPTSGTAGGNDTTDKVFLLSIAEAQNTAYGFTNNASETDTRKAVNTAYVYGGGKNGTAAMYEAGKADRWWLRSPGEFAEYVASVDYDGVVTDDNTVTHDFYTVRPAFNLNLSSVLFTSAAEGGKPEAFGEVAAYDGNEYKVTVKDDSRSGFTAQIIKFADKYSVSYSGAKTGDNEYISAIVKNADGDITHYGRLAKPTTDSGICDINITEFDIPDTSTLYLFNEQYNGDYKTDFAGEPKTVTVPEEVNAYHITSTLENTKTSNKAVFRMTNDTTDYTATLTADDGYVLPESITVKVGGTELADADYTYSYETGKLKIQFTKIKGDVEIICSSIKLEKVTFDVSGEQQIYESGTARTVTMTPIYTENSTGPLPKDAFKVQYYEVDENKGVLKSVEAVTSAVAPGKYLYVIDFAQAQRYYAIEKPFTVSDTTLPDILAYDNIGYMLIKSGITGQQTPIYFKDGTVNLKVNDTYTNELTNENGTTPTFTSSNEAVATVDASGKVKAVGKGTATITAKSTKDETTPVYASYTVNVGLATVTLKAEHFIVTAQDKVYDETDEVKISAVLKDNIAYGGDNIKFDITGYFADKNAGNNKKVAYTITGISGTGAENYVLDNGKIEVAAENSEVKANITRAAVTIICATTTTRTFDGSTQKVDVSAMANGAVFDSKYYTVMYAKQNADGYDSATSTAPSAVGSYAVSIELTEEAAMNYTVAQPNATLIINKATQEVFSIEGVPETVYYGDDFTVSTYGTDGTVTYKLTEGGEIADINETSGKVVISGVGRITIEATSTKDGYNPRYATKTFEAKKRVLTPTATAIDRTYNGENGVEVTISLENVLDDDKEKVSATGTGTMVNADVGTDKIVYVSGITLDGEHKDLYTLSSTSVQTTVDIEQREITSFSFTSESKTYNGSDYAEAYNIVLEAENTENNTGVLEADKAQVSLIGTASYGSADVGEYNVTYTATGLSGAKVANYKLVADKATTAETYKIEAMLITFEIGTKSFVYDGEDKVITVSASDENGKIFKDYTIEYTDENGDTVTPNAAGTYTATVELNNSKNYTTNQEDITVTISEATQDNLVIVGLPGTIQYGAEFDLEAVGGEDGGTYEWTVKNNADVTLSATDTATTTVTIGEVVGEKVEIEVVKKTDNYEDISAKVVFVPTQKAVTFNISKLEQTYGGISAVEVAPSDTNVSEEDYTITYNGGELPENAGTYTVKVTATGNYTGMQTATLVIKKATATGTLEMDADSYTYGSTDKISSKITLDNDLDIGDFNVDIKYGGTGIYVAKSEAPTTVGKYTAIATLTRDNYETLTLTDDFEIKKATLTVKANNAERAYGAANPIFELTYGTVDEDGNIINGFVNGETKDVLLSEPIATVTANASSDVGKYYITTSGGNAENYQFEHLKADNYDSEFGILTVTSAEGTLYITGSTNTAYVNDVFTLHAFIGNSKVNVTWGLDESSDADVVTIDSNGTVTAKKSGTVTITAIAGSNYNNAKATFNLTVKQTGIILVPTGLVKTYTGERQDISFAETDGFDVKIGENVRVEYTLISDPSVTEPKQVGTYSVVYTITDGSYTGGGNTTMYINKATVSVSADAISKEYGEEPEYKIVASDNVAGIDADKIKAFASFASDGAAKTANVGEYDITVTLLTESDENCNYVVNTEANGKLTVTPATLTVNVENMSREYGAENPTELKYTITGFKNDETAKILTGSLAPVYAETIGTDITTYEDVITAAGTLENGNYTVQIAYADGEGADLTITKILVTASAGTARSSYLTIKLDKAVAGLTAESFTVKNGEEEITLTEVSASSDNKTYTLKGSFVANVTYTVTTTIESDTHEIISEALSIKPLSDGSGSGSGGGGGGGGSSSSAATCTVTFETNGGSEIDSVKVTKNKTADEPTAPTRDGYTFGGWYTDKELTTAYDFDTKVTKAVTLYAKWTENEAPDTDDKTAWENPFTDVKADDWYYENVRYAVENGLFNGTTETTFAPDGIITRAMMVTVLYRAEGEPEASDAAAFEDVDRGAYYAKAVAWGQQNGIIKGYSEAVFAPDQNITREQIAAIMHRYASYKGYDVSVGENTNILSYTDYESISEYAIASMQYAVGSGLMKGKTTSTLNPLDNATRAEIAAILNRFIEADK